MVVKLVNIPEINVEMFEGAMDKLVKLSKKLNSESIKYNRIGEKVECISKKQEPIKKYMKYYTYEIFGSTPTLNGYKLVAMLERQKTLNLITHIDKTIKLPDGLDTKENYCEHCNTNRARKYLFILLEEATGKLIQVGKSCVKDFTGWHKNPEMVANWYSYIEEIDGYEDYDEERLMGGGYSHYTNYHEALRVIAISAYFTDHDGYVKSCENTPKNPSTAYKTRNYHHFAKIENIESEGYFEKAEEVKKWIMAQSNESDYMMNLQTLIKEGVVSDRKIGYLASAYFSYKRALEREKEIKREAEAKKPSDFVGEVKERKTFTLTYDREITYDTDFGLTHIYFFHDENDNVLIWKTTNWLEIEEGETISIKGTVKDHNEYRGVKQTVLTRCKVA